MILIIVHNLFLVMNLYKHDMVEVYQKIECTRNGKFGADPIFYGNNWLTKQMTHDYICSTTIIAM